MNPTTFNADLEDHPIRSRSLRAKRAFDLIIAVPATILLSPLFIVIAIGIKFDSRGPVFFRQRRIGQFGRQFRIFKFRTMAPEAETQGAQITIDQD
ncbi:MAG: sugar transferase, partial [Blastocatellia bacterium]